MVILTRYYRPAVEPNIGPTLDSPGGRPFDRTLLLQRDQMRPVTSASRMASHGGRRHRPGGVGNVIWTLLGREYRIRYCTLPRLCE